MKTINRLLEEHQIYSLQLQWLDLNNHLHCFRVPLDEHTRTINADFKYTVPIKIGCKTTLLELLIGDYFYVDPFSEQPTLNILCYANDAKLCSRRLLKQVHTKHPEDTTFQADFHFLITNTQQHLEPNLVGQKTGDILQMIASTLKQTNVPITHYYVTKNAQCVLQTQPLKAECFSDTLVHIKYIIENVCCAYQKIPLFAPKISANAPQNNMPIKQTILSENIDTSNYVEAQKTFMPALCAATNPTRNSYARLNETTISHLPICLAKHQNICCITYHLPDACAQPYLSIALCMSIGLLGLEEKTNEPKTLLVPVHLETALNALESVAPKLEKYGVHLTLIEHFLKQKRDELHTLRCQPHPDDVLNFLSKHTDTSFCMPEK